ncbi:hypothetical protein [Chryseobacterium sp. KMC2]|uniref:hypothetical protein n=1 Tax=Chryseobacterium sp. KMC2 TaxID=2800705 RepID=UPI0019227D5C|nr:hypothetical protein [Chryseobacterium sp. KMC2]MBL3548124.1 hypothetical protein [Chryseobacterium sp. KMC2]
MDEYYILIPKSLNLEQRLSKFPPDFELSRDYCYYFISELIKQVSNQNCSDEFKDFHTATTHFTSRCAGINQSIYRNSRLHIDYLYQDFGGEGRMLWRHNYKPGSCYSYYLPKYYWGDGELELICIREKALVEKVRKINKPSVDNAVRKHLNFTIQYFDTKRIELDHKSPLNELYLDYKRTGDYAKYLKNAVMIQNLKNNGFHFHYNPETDGRLHTALSQFPKIGRKYLKYDGEHIAEVDLSSSVPFFLAYLLSLPASSKSAVLHAHLPHSENLLYHYMLVESSVSPSTKEIADFRELVLNNQLYESFMTSFMDLQNFDSGFENMFGREFDGDEDELRKYTKKRLLSMFFAHQKEYKQEQTVFYSYFPTIYQLIKKYKQAKFQGVSKFERHKRFSHLLFQLESHFMLNIIAREINNKFKRKIPFFTLHDCLMVRESDLEQAYELMNEIFIREIGYAPNMTKKVWK